MIHTRTVISRKPCEQGVGLCLSTSSSLKAARDLMHIAVTRRASIAEATTESIAVMPLCSLDQIRIVLGLQSEDAVVANDVDLDTTGFQERKQTQWNEQIRGKHDRADMRLGLCSSIP